MRLWFLNVLIDAIKTSIQIAKPRGSYLEERCQKDVSVRGTTQGCLCCFLSLARVLGQAAAPWPGPCRVLCPEWWQKGAAGRAGRAQPWDPWQGEPQFGACFCGFWSVRKMVTVAFSVCIRELMVNSPLNLLISADLKAVTFSLFCQLQA